MAHEFTLSAFGLKLIKAYEGFRPVETTLVSGQRVIGYGHKYSPNEEAVVSRAKAETILKDDLAPYEALVNENVFAPLSQSQFDALVSLSFNIGPRAFLSSNTLHALNNGRPLDAANNFDEWRKSTIENKVYVVDALVRRRTAEKALFLRPTVGAVHSPRHEVPPMQDHIYNGAGEATPTFNNEDARGIVDQTPYAAQKAKFRRRDDGPAGILTLSEIDNSPNLAEATRTDDIHSNEEPTSPKEGETLSPIAIAAAELSERLDLLIADTADTKDEATHAPIDKTSDVAKGTQELPPQNTAIEPQPLAAANEGTREDYRRPSRAKPVQTRGPEAFIQNTKAPSRAQPRPDKFGAYWVSLFIGATLLAGGAFKWFSEPNTLDQVSAFVAPAATIVGAMVVVGALYYLLKAVIRGR